MTAEDDERLSPHRIRAAFAVISTAIVHALARAMGKGDLDTTVEIARLYSSEVEYSEENMERFFDLLEDAYSLA